VAPFLTVSIGVSTRNPGDPFSDEELVARADQALYRAKSTGRNRISVYQKG
jgi:diguanylate cyclase (GGDEF)-like protein